MLPIFWLESADADLDRIIGYIAQRNYPAAERLWHRLRESVLPLAEHPYLYRQSERVPGLREIVAHPNYLVLYRVTATHVEVVGVVHARRNFPGEDAAAG
ncbi:type II toxin-antitoxin system RelE/ParE family toxin [Ottowia sp.]|uniref:type II toxin-antitoxin system RelE/ParE family toxin n=1 Tax=Ottowia sp. TaxID=1898956 RepID=UPI0039E25453